MYSLSFPKVYNQENTSETLNLVCFIEFYLRLCWLVSLALETIYGTNIFGAAAGDEVESIFSLGYLSVLLVLRGELKPALLKAIFHQSLTQWLLEELEELEGFSHPQLYAALINLNYCHLFLFLRRRN